MLSTGFTLPSSRIYVNIVGHLIYSYFNWILIPFSGHVTIVIYTPIVWGNNQAEFNSFSLPLHNFFVQLPKFMLLVPLCITGFGITRRLPFLTASTTMVTLIKEFQRFASWMSLMRACSLLLQVNICCYICFFMSTGGAHV